MSKKEVTSKRIASKAAKTLNNPSSSKAAKSAAGSALSQRKAPNKQTSVKAGKAAAKTLGSSSASKAAKSTAGSALTQRPSKGTNSGGPRGRKK
ncbi:hypothetical protein [Pseudoxanthomonas suwonensis]|uniref:hypothetical protein n=1 Tax=Pseudoxanthomonas suwonensis TaxID=314722 RepID=UPI0009E09D23|nr:hypothetical protein [Pseudoxanthomonas suwonensis]